MGTVYGVNVTAPTGREGTPRNASSAPRRSSANLHTDNFLRGLDAAMLSADHYITASQTTITGDRTPGRV